MKTDDIVSNLEALGMEAPHASIYVLLHQAGSARAGAIAHELALSRPRTYRLLADMAKRGFIAVSLTRPLTYSSKSAQDVVASLGTEVERRRKLLEELAPKLVPAIEGLRAGSHMEKPRERLELVQGSREYHRVAGRMMSEAQRVVRTISTVPAPAGRGKRTAMAELAPRGRPGHLEMRVLLGETTTEDQASVEEFLESNPRASVRTATGLPIMRLTIRDEDEVLLGAIVDAGHRTSDGDLGIRSNAPALVRSQLTFFERLWDEARPFAVRKIVV